MERAPKVTGSGRRRSGHPASLLAVFGLLLVPAIAACGEDGPLADVTITVTAPDDGDEEAVSPEETTVPPETVPPETAPPETAPPDETPDDAPDDDGGVSGTTILLIAVLGGLAVAAVLGAAGIVSSRSRSKEIERAAERSRLAELVGGYRWVHDQGSMEVMRTSDPNQLRRAWQTTNASIVQLEGMVSAMALEADSPERRTALDDLGRASAGLRNAIESDISLRADPAGCVVRQDRTCCCADDDHLHKGNE